MTIYKHNVIAKMLFTLLLLLPVAGFSQDTGIYCSSSTTWNGTTWSNGEPSANKDVIFNGNYTFNGETLNACSIFVLDGANVLFTEKANAVIVHNVTVAQTATLIFESDSNLIQTLGDKNTGKVTVKRKSSKVKKDDFTLWSSPVSGQNLLGFSPQTLTNRFYTYNSTENIYNTVQAPATTTFEAGKGYLIRIGEEHSESPDKWEATFTGVPNTGEVTIPLSYVNDAKAYNAVGNPYPSPISVTRFLNDNSNVIDGTLWLWRKTDDPAKSSYAALTKLGYQANTPYDSNNSIQNPYLLDAEGIINTGQGFIVKAKASKELVFNNAIRKAVNTDIFFRTAVESDAATVSRFWLNVTADNVFSQTLIGYTPEATIDFDYGMDGESIMDGGITFYSIAAGKNLAIQARPAFTASDVVRMGFKAQSAGTFTVALDHMDGLFAQGQDIYLKDKTTGAIHDLTNGSYSFTSAAGTFEDRFTIVYTQTLGTNNPQNELNDVIVYSNNNKLKIESTEQIQSVFVYDLLGRILFENDNVNDVSFASTPINTQQVIIAKIILSNTTVITKKITLQL